MDGKKQQKSNVYEDIYTKINTLPSLPQIIYKISDTLSDPNSSIEEVIQVLQFDPAITGRVLRLANSAYIGMPQRVSSLKNAVVILGRKRIYSLVFTASVLSLFKSYPLHTFDMKRFWKHSATVAMVAESIGKHLKRYELIDPDELFCSGILHDIGKLILSIFKPDHIQWVYQEAENNHTPFYRNEDELLSHTTIGSLAAQHWGFPKNLIGAIKYHHHPFEMHTDRKAVLIIQIADIIAHTIGLNTRSGEMIPEIYENMTESLGLSPEYLRAIAHKTLKKEKQLESLFTFIS